MKNSEPKDVEKLTYEEAFAELMSLVEALESDEHPLDETMRLFERGQTLSRRCTVLLDNAELKVQQLNGENLVDVEIE
ncbi:MAG: exodeoxyribonuclease VII small subunit [Chloroflexi bacterium GWB2_49_20]|nr:MAG: exodeoxyribonuclease VII small subunit [Chloroflexi bacterium GWB2_49_20]OGN78659.1 MAG: exodeoxyribonuclease VII small subunit [Chloroflexi bacterium GWC2_49_37]OGN85761.1 MAG: exodeoxyribonuclease VII small subunit [Chloroflexi bacterium GWD2_49_16]